MAKVKKKNNKEKVVKKELRKYEKQIKRRLTYFRVFLIFSILIIVSFVVLFRSSKFLRVEINGLNRLSAIDIINNSSIRDFNNKNLFLVPLDKIALEVEKNPMLEVISVERKIPDLILINIKEKDTVALLEYNNNIYEIAYDGTILKQLDAFNYDLPYLTGFNIGDNPYIITDEYTKYTIEMLNSLKDENKEAYDLISEIK